MKRGMTFDQIYAIPQEKVEEILKRVNEKCRNDKGFDEELHDHPAETLKKEGLTLQPGLSFQLVQSVEEANSLPDNVIPVSFKKEILALDDLQKVVGGKGQEYIAPGPHGEEVLVGEGVARRLEEEGVSVRKR